MNYRCDICRTVTIAVPAFGTGVLMTLFFPPIVLVGACAAGAVGFGVLCVLSKW